MIAPCSVKIFVSPCLRGDSSTGIGQIAFLQDRLVAPGIARCEGLSRVDRHEFISLDKSLPFSSLFHRDRPPTALGIDPETIHLMKAVSMFRPFLFAALLGFTVLAMQGVADELVLRGTIVDLDQKPIAGAEATLHRWDGTMSPALETKTTDDRGEFEFSARPNDAYYYVIIRKASFAPVSHVLGTEGPIKTTLRPAVKTWIDVRSAKGDLLKGARLTSLAIRTPENAETFVWRGMEHLFDYEFGPSDETGRLNLPPLPKGAIIDLRVDHPQWAQARLGNATVEAGPGGSLTLPAGVITTFEFVTDPKSPFSLEGVSCEVLLLSQTSDSAASIMRVPMPIKDNAFRFCAHPGTYDMARLKAPGLAITPNFDRLAIGREGEPKVRLLVRKTVNLSGRVMHKDGTPHPGASVHGRIRNLSPDGPVQGENQWSYLSSVETDAEGKFTVTLAPGRCRVEFQAEGFTSDRDETELDVLPDGPNEIPDFITERLEPLRGRVVDENNRPVPEAIVRVRHPALMGHQPAICDAEGKYEIVLPWVPLDLDTQERQHELDVVAFVADRPLMGVTRVDLRQRESGNLTKILLKPDPSADSLLSMKDNQWSADRRQKWRAERENSERYPAGERGQLPPELDGAAWFNTDARSLKDLRGRYVLLDFWFTGCGPCHGDFPSVKLVHERLAKLGVTVVAVHDNSSTPDAVQEHSRKLGLSFPIVVDHPDGRILDAYCQLGVSSFPSYILLGPDGKILENDQVTDGPSLRTFKIEAIRRYVLEGRK